MTRITILHCSETLGLSGCCRVMEHLAKGVDATRFESMFCAGGGDADYLDYLRAQNITPLLLQGGALPPIPKPFVAVLHRSGNATPFWDGLIAQLRAAGAQKIIERNIFGYADAHLDRICANSLNTLWHHWRHSGRPEVASYLTRHRVLYNAVSFLPSEGELLKLRAQWRRKLDIAPDAFVVGIVTRPDAKKIDALILGMARHLKKTIPNFVLVTRRYPPLLAMLLKIMLGKQYHNLPVSADEEALKATYAIMDVCGNFPSIGESFGMAMAEAMRCYKPVVALDLPYADKGNSQRELIEQGVNGYLVASASEVASAFEKLASDAALREQMGIAAQRKMTSAPFALESVMAQFEACVSDTAAPVLPDVETMQRYLETYPVTLKSAGLAVAGPVLRLQVAAFRLAWKAVRKCL